MSAYERSEATGNDPCRVVEISNVNDDDLQDAKLYVPEIPNDLDERAADLKKFSR